MLATTMATPRKTTNTSAKPTASGRPSTRRKAPAKVASAPPRTAPTLAEIGREAQHEAQRKALLASLKRCDWNMTAAAKELGLVNSSNVLRAIRTLGLEAEYDAAPCRMEPHRRGSWTFQTPYARTRDEA